jgi:hypothetical protein
MLHRFDPVLSSDPRKAISFAPEIESRQRSQNERLRQQPASGLAEAISAIANNKRDTVTVAAATFSGLGLIGSNVAIPPPSVYSAN